MVLVRFAATEAIHGFIMLVIVPAARKRAGETIHTRSPPLLEYPVNISVIKIPVIVREQDTLGHVFRVRQELLVETVFFGDPETDGNMVLAYEVVWGLCRVIVPSNDDFVEGGRLICCEMLKGFV